MKLKINFKWTTDLFPVDTQLIVFLHQKIGIRNWHYRSIFRRGSISRHFPSENPDHIAAKECWWTYRATMGPIYPSALLYCLCNGPNKTSTYSRSNNYISTIAVELSHVQTRRQVRSVDPPRPPILDMAGQLWPPNISRAVLFRRNILLRVWQQLQHGILRGLHL